MTPSLERLLLWLPWSRQSFLQVFNPLPPHGFLPQYPSSSPPVLCCVTAAALFGGGEMNRL